eukprot:TRINITY_DN29535_c0_g1_i2.p1 TRINITY_DN29535_c0_g1~~TRINITY_DN29535_c0_g1_i2.p1  ORF type:complete len:641 (-),score=106.02 TRINITY_DN29535_c0_g1_i2:573-2495(-)
MSCSGDSSVVNHLTPDGWQTAYSIQDKKLEQTQLKAERYKQSYEELLQLHGYVLNQVSDLKEENENLKSEIEKKEQEFTNKQEEIKQLNLMMEDQQSMIERIKKQNQEWKNQTVKVSQQKKKIMQEVEKQMSPVRKSAQRLTDQALVEIKTEYQQLQERYDQQKKVCSWLETDQNTKQLEILYLKAQLEELEKGKEQLQSDLEEKKRVEQQLTHKLKICVEEKLSLSCQLEQNQNTKKKAIDNYNDLKNEMQAETDKAAELQLKNDELSKQVRELVGESRQKDWQIVQLKEQVARTQQEAQQIQQQLKQQQAQQQQQDHHPEADKQQFRDPEDINQNINNEGNLQNIRINNKDNVRQQQQQQFQEEQGQETSEEVQDEQQEDHQPADSTDLLLSGEGANGSQKINRALNNIQTHIIDRIQETPRDQEPQEQQQKIGNDIQQRQLIFDENDTDNCEGEGVQEVQMRQQLKDKPVQRTPLRKSSRKRSSGREWWCGNSPKKNPDIVPQEKVQVVQNGKRKMYSVDDALKNPKRKKQTGKQNMDKNANNKLIGQSQKAGVLEVQETKKRRKATRAGKLVEEEQQHCGRKAKAKKKQVELCGKVVAERNPRSQLTSMSQLSQIDPLEVIFGYKPVIPKLLNKQK